ncbi:M14 family metallopeptidase [Leadbetterella byssophila]|uniref:M14 family metallopeptidase n=1 Tax=Leadbetterella byssophila TaxID=316068 RepID=UPI0039A0511F
MYKILLLMSFSITLIAQNFKGQEPIKPVDTRSRPTLERWKGRVELGDVIIENKFEGGACEQPYLDSTGAICIPIVPENEPINSSPWYAFRISTEEHREVEIKLIYPSKYKHRYDPKWSGDRVHWHQLGGKSSGSEYTFYLELSNRPLFVASQPLFTSSDVYRWILDLTGSEPLKIGNTPNGLPIPYFEIGNKSSKRQLVFLGRQHPPEVTGHKAMQYFIEELSQLPEFTDNYHALVLPLLNPDGVDAGNWRHNSRGVDLNRDWYEFHQDETRLVRDFLKNWVQGDLIFSIDFHSTYEDIYYIVNPDLKKGRTRFVEEWIKTSSKHLPDYSPHIKPLYFEPPTSTAFSYLFETYGTEALVFEIGDKTEDEFIRKKSRASARELVEILKKY